MYLFHPQSTGGDSAALYSDKIQMKLRKGIAA